MHILNKLKAVKTAKENLFVVVVVLQKHIFAISGIPEKEIFSLENQDALKNMVLTKTTPLQNMKMKMKLLFIWIIYALG